MKNIKNLITFIEKELNNSTDLAIITSQKIGKVIEITDGIVKILGLKNVSLGELIEFEEGTIGIAFNLEKDCVKAILMKTSREIRQGSFAFATEKIAEIPVSDKLLGRVVNALGSLIDKKEDFIFTESRLIEAIAPGVINRSPINEPLQTGILAIDSLIPIGKGQRQLIAGDRQTGKTSIAVDTILNQKNKDIICIYIAIGQRTSAISEVVSLLEEKDAMKYCIILVASANDSAILQYLAPYAGTSIAEYFMYKGKNVLIVYDDLTKHAEAYRQMSLLLRRPSGREAFPGDIFYLHSRLLERSAKLNDSYGGGTITALPIIETEADDISSYIPTNVISITDGQIFLSKDLFNLGFRPAIDIGLSVSRIGSKAQIKAMKQVAGELKLDLAQFFELKKIALFSSDLESTVASKIDKGKCLHELLKQSKHKLYSIEEQVCLIYAGVNGFLDSIPLVLIAVFSKELQKLLQDEYIIIIKKIRKYKEISFEIEELLNMCILKAKENIKNTV